MEKVRVERLFRRRDVQEGRPIRITCQNDMVVVGRAVSVDWERPFGGFVAKLRTGAAMPFSIPCPKISNIELL